MLDYVTIAAIVISLVVLVWTLAISFKIVRPTYHDSTFSYIKCPYCSFKIVEAAITLVILAFIGMSALTQLFQAFKTSVPSTVITMVRLLIGIMFALGIALAFYRFLVKDT